MRRQAAGWVRPSARPTSAALARLTLAEGQLYAALVSDDLGSRVRLEQERIDWHWVERALRDRG